MTFTPVIRLSSLFRSEVFLKNSFYFSFLPFIQMLSSVMSLKVRCERLAILASYSEVMTNPVGCKGTIRESASPALYLKESSSGSLITPSPNSR
jgi:hypothetical protein